MFVVGSCNFDAPKNLKCVRQQGLFDIKYLKFLILFIIPRETLYSPKTYLPYFTSAFEKNCCDWNLNNSAPLPHKFREILKISLGWASEWCKSNQAAKHFSDYRLVIPHGFFVDTPVKIPLLFWLTSVISTFFNTLENSMSPPSMPPVWLEFFLE